MERFATMGSYEVVEKELFALMAEVRRFA